MKRPILKYSGGGSSSAESDMFDALDYADEMDKYADYLHKRIAELEAENKTILEIYHNMLKAEIVRTKELDRLRAERVPDELLEEFWQVANHTGHQ
jgi:hypothetical protein